MAHRVALVVDDEPGVCRVLVRMLRTHFDEVLTVNCPSEADEALSTRPVTHLVCDCFLGQGLPLGSDLIPGWRALYPSIRRAVVFTGNDLTRVPGEVDAVVRKAGDPAELLRALGVLG
jgi:CheY-like chemotaxis protein